MDTTYKTLACHFRPPIVSIILNRPRVSNRVNLLMAMELRHVFQQMNEEDGARVVIITGRGRAFSAGREHISFGRGASRSHTPSDWLELHRAASTLAGAKIPVIASVNGDALDHGLELALACDLRIAARGVSLGSTDLSRGVVPWDGGTQRLPRLVGKTLAMEMLLTFQLLDAEEACRVGLVNSVVEPDVLAGSAEKMALEIASGAPVATRYAKEAVLKGMDMTLEQGLRLETDFSILLQSTADRAEGLRSFLERRDPEFRGE